MSQQLIGEESRDTFIKLFPSFVEKKHFVKTHCFNTDTKELSPAPLFFFVRCAELLVMKAELELMKGAIEESRLDLDKVRNLLEICSGLENSLYTLAVSRHLHV